MTLLRIRIVLTIVFFSSSKCVFASIGYIKPPRVIKNEAFPTSITETPLNQHSINHKSKGSFSLTGAYGADQDYNLFPNVLYRVKGEVVQSLSTDQVFTSDQRGHYVQLMSVVKNQNITLTKTEAQTMFGQVIQLSFTGSCSALLKGEDPEQQCALAPSITTDRNSIDPSTNVPTQISFGSYGEKISKESLAILAQPGFQSVGANGQQIGVDLYFPNSGSFAGNTQSKETDMTRIDDISTTPLFGYSRVRKILKANHSKSVMGLTIHGFGSSWDSDNIGINLGISSAAQLLPDVVPSLSGGEKVNTDININLLNAAKNTRLPINSWTIYQAGLGEADHPTTENNIRITPNAHFNSFWLGLSPVRESSFSFDTHHVFTGEEIVTIDSGGEGGVLDNVSFVSAVNDKTIESGTLDNFYIQAYLKFLNRDINFISTTKLKYRTTYYPHLSYSGNVTGSTFAARYYGGVILSKYVKPYVGVDYTYNFWKGWSFHGNAIYYHNQNQEYYSHAAASLSKYFNVWKGYGVTLHSSTRYAFERRIQQFLEEPIDNFVDVGLNVNLSGWATLGASYYFGDLLPDSIKSAWKFNASARPWKYVSLQAFFVPYNSQHSYGASISISNGKQSEQLSLTLGWQHRKYEYGADAFGENLKSEHDIFTVNMSYQF